MNFFIFNCLTLNIKLFIFKLFDVKFFVFQKSCLSQTEETAVNGIMDLRSYLQILNSPGKMMTCYLRDINKFLRYRTLCKSILKYRFPTKGIKLTQFVLFEVIGVPQLWGTWFRPLVRFCICSQHRGFPLPWWYFPVPRKAFKQSEKLVLYYYEKKW